MKKKKSTQKTRGLIWRDRYIRRVIKAAREEVSSNSIRMYIIAFSCLLMDSTNPKTKQSDLIAQDLAKMFDIDVSQTSKIFRKMEALGLIKRVKGHRAEKIIYLS